MKYFHVQWITKNKNVAYSMYYEVDYEEIEARKIHIYPDGRCDFAMEGRESKETWLSPEKFPSLDEINEDQSLIAKEITESEFEEVWEIAVAQYRK